MIPYQAFTAHLKKLHVLASPSELQAHAAGMLCIDKDMAYESWAGWVHNEYCVDGATDSGLDVVLMAVFDMTKDQLGQEDYSFELLLPDDEPSLSLRLAALVDWVNAYMSALGLAGMKGQHKGSEEVDEFLLDLERISRLDTDEEGIEGEELDLMEITEYVRTGVMLMYGELNQFEAIHPTIN